MGINDRKVGSIIGKDIWKHILDEVSDGAATAQNMKDIARLLNSKVNGSHLQRMEKSVMRRKCGRSLENTTTRRCMTWTHTEQ